MDINFFANALTHFLALIIALTFHEAAHAFTAKWQGDTTAESEGRLTLNPIPHIDPIGTLLMPAMMIFMQIPILFGWAKPVPVDPRNFKNQKWGYVLVALAGPLANLIFCFFCVVIINIYVKFLSNTLPPGHFLYPLILLFKSLMWINAILAIFNLIPLTPLDGGTVFMGILPENAKNFYEDYIAPYGSFILLALLITGGLGWIGQIAEHYVILVQKVVHSLI